MIDNSAGPSDSGCRFPSGTDRGLLAVGIVASVCLAWTVWIMLLTAAPNTAVNYLMGTEIFDDGSFWRFINPPPAMLVTGLGGLGIDAIAYLYIIARLVMLRHRAITKIKVAIKIAAVADRRDLPNKPQLTNSKPHTVVVHGATALAMELAKEDSLPRKRVNLCVKFVDFGTQFILLFDLMERGLPVVLVRCFASLIVMNALSTAMALSFKFAGAGLYELLLDTVFDILVAVVYPMIAIVYCMSAFSVDRRVIAINMKVFPPGWFERGASVISDPVETEVIRTTFNSLRVTSMLTALARIGVNWVLSRRFYQLTDRISDPAKRKRSIYPKTRLIAVVFVLIGVASVVLTEESVRRSNLACRSHPECIRNAWRWIRLQDDDNLSQCPCLTLIDVDTRLKTYEEWLNPPDVTLKVAQLAASGDLQTINLINRQLPVLPDELRRCKSLKHLSLMYTHTKVLPTWTKEFTELGYLHIENKLGVSSRTDMPADMFADMAALTFIHFGINDVERLPSLDGLTNLESLSIAVFANLEELPSFRNLSNLARLVLACIPLLRTLPDLASTPKLEAFAVFDRGQFCCNGFASECDLTHSMCRRHLVWGSPPATCLLPNEAATPATRSMLKKFSATVCAGQALVPGQLETGPTPELTRQCNGTMYKRCIAPGYDEAMCYNPRLMGITCDGNPLPIEMRRRQIAEGVGELCDPEIEAWLGCR